MEPCIRCKERPKVGYKYCEVCKPIAKREKEVASQKRARLKARKPCLECGVELTNTKYCKSCAQSVKTRNDRKRIQTIRKNKKLGKTEKVSMKNKKRPPIDPKWLTRGNISSSTRACQISNGA